MANDVVGYTFHVSGETHYAIISDRDRKVCDIDAADGSFETFVVASLGTYDSPLTETPASSNRYQFTFPSFIAAGRYEIEFFIQAGGSPAVGDALINKIVVDWDGSEIVDGGNVGSVGGDSTAATNLRQSSLALQTGTVQTAEASANTATVFDTNLTLEADDYYGSADGGLVIAFVSGTTNQFQTRRLVASSTGTLNTRITLEEALDATPADADAFVVLGRITELS